MVRPFTAAWLAGDPAASTFIPLSFPDPTARAAAVARAASRALDPRVLAVLAAQNRALPPSAARNAALETLAAGPAAMVVTGQQTGLFLGPLYVIHKAATAVRTAAALSAETGIPVVPVFWLQTEDADFEEIRTITTPTEHGSATVSLADPLTETPDGHRVSVAHRPLGPSVSEAIATLTALHGHDRHAEAVFAAIERHYRPETLLPDAFAGLLADLFTATPLLFLNPRDPGLAPLTAPFMARALDASDTLAAALVTQANALHTNNFKVQVHPRAGASLLCFHPDGPAGPRYRLVRSPDFNGRQNSWHLSGRRPDVAIPTALLHDRIASDPLCFSTTALLRPALQDHLLPTAAYVGGPGEIAYYAQMAPVYETFGQTPPLLVPRARLRLVTATARRLAEQLGLDVADITPDRDALIARLPAAATAGPDLATPVAALQAWEDAATIAAERLGPQDAGLAKAIRKTLHDIRHHLERIDDRMTRAAVAADSVATQRIDRLLGLLHPNGTPQERTLAFVHFAAQVGPERLIEAILEAATPFEHQLKDVQP